MSPACRRELPSGIKRSSPRSMRVMRTSEGKSISLSFLPITGLVSSTQKRAANRSTFSFPPSKSISSSRRSYTGLTRKTSPIRYPTATPRTAGRRNAKFHVSSTVMMTPVSGARTTVVKNTAMQMTMSASAYPAGIPIFCKRSPMSAPSPAPIASMGINAPHGTPAPMLKAVTSNLRSTIIMSDAQSGAEKTESTPSEALPSEAIKT